MKSKSEIKQTNHNDTQGLFIKRKFSKDNTLVLKGIAIIMMLFYHLFSSDPSVYSNYNISFFPFPKGEMLTEILAVFKICVSIFVFITGYGLTISLKKLHKECEWNRKQIGKWIVDRLIKTLSGFWIIAIISYSICQVLDGRTGNIFFKDDFLYGMVKMLLNFFGLSQLFKLNLFNPAWWYMSIAVLFVFSVPIFLKLFKKYNYLFILLAVIVIPRVIGWKYVNNSYISFLFPLLLGIIFAENNFMVKIANIKLNKNVYVSKIIKFIIETMIVAFLVLLYTQLPKNLFWEIRYGIMPVCLICYLYEFFLDFKIVNIVFGFLGKNSINVFLIHEFIRKYYLRDFIYSFRNFLKIGVALLSISLAISIILELFKKIIRYDKFVNKLQKTVGTQIDKIEK